MAFTSFILCLSQAEQNSGESHYTMEFGKFPAKMKTNVIKHKPKKLTALIEDTKKEIKECTEKLQQLD